VLCLLHVLLWLLLVIEVCWCFFVVCGAALCVLCVFCIFVDCWCLLAMMLSVGCVLGVFICLL